MRNKEGESEALESIMDSKYTTGIEEDGEKNLELIGSDEGIHEIKCSSNMGSILREFTKLYTDKLDRLSSGGEEELKRKVSVLECWINDLGEQNSILVSTVEELEREASRRVSLLQEELDKMAVVTKESCVSLRDHQLEVTSLVKQKVSAEEEVMSLQEKILDQENTNTSLQRENSELRQDLENILEVINRARMTGRWVCEDFNFKSLRPEQILGRQHLSTFRHPDGAGEQRLSVFQDIANSEASEGEQDSVASTLSFDTDRQNTISKLKSDIKRMKETQLETHAILNQRDAHIAELQSELTNFHEKLGLAQSQIENTTLTLQTLMDRGRHDSLEICRRDEMIRQILSASHLKGEMFKPSDRQIDLKSKLDVEVQLSGNIDIMSMRLAELEEECQRLRHQNEWLKSAPSIRSLSEDEQDHFAITYAPNSTPPSRKVDSQIQVKLLSKQVQTEKVSPGDRDRSEMKTNEHFVMDRNKISKLENELSEKNILIRELQSHLIISREELQLKDDTLHNIEQKLDSTRRKYDDKEERMHYLTSQLTNLQLELSRLHGTTQHLRSQLEMKSELVHKVESENRCLVRQLNEKSSLFERMERDHSKLLREMDWSQKEAAEQKATIGTLQDALTSTKMNFDRLSTQYNTESGCNLNTNQSNPALLHRDRIDTLPLKPISFKNCVSHLPSPLPDLRPLNSSTSPLSRNCPDIVSFLSRRNSLSGEINQATRDSSFYENTSSYSSKKIVEVKPLTASLPYLQSLDAGLQNDSKSLTALSPSDSGIGSEDFNLVLGKNCLKLSQKRSGRFGRIYEI